LCGLSFSLPLPPSPPPPALHLSFLVSLSPSLPLSRALLDALSAVKRVLMRSFFSIFSPTKFVEGIKKITPPEYRTSPDRNHHLKKTTTKKNKHPGYTAKRP
jgi:hypothetical protein